MSDKWLHINTIGEGLAGLHSPSTKIRFARPCGTTGNRFFSCKRPISYTCLRDWVTIARENSRQQQRRRRRWWWWLTMTTMNIRASILHCTYHVCVCAERCNCAIGGVEHGARSIRWVILDGTYVRTVTRCNRNRVEGREMTGRRIIIFFSRPNRRHISQFASRFLVVCASSSFRWETTHNFLALALLLRSFVPESFDPSRSVRRAACRSQARIRGA